MIIFPTVNGSNLLRKKMSLPADFKGQMNLLFIAFKQWQQSEVNSWVPWIKEMESKYPGLVYYELPVIEDRSSLSKWFINEGMRAGIPNPVTRERTITLYLNKDEFRKSLDLLDEEHIYIVLLGRNDDILHRERGVFIPKTAAQLEKMIASL